MEENIFIIGIAGGSGSGKTTFLREIQSGFFRKRSLFYQFR